MVKTASRDSRIGSSHTLVPGHDGKRGFGGTCFPKEVSALLSDMESLGIDSYILKNTLLRNNTVDRSECEWKLNKGRSVI